MFDISKLEDYASINSIPIMQKEGIEFLISKLNESSAKSLLEIGSAIGYSAIMLADNVPGLKVETIELDDGRYCEAVKNITEAGLGDRVIIHADDALLLDTNNLVLGEYDVLFIDAAKAQYQRFLEKYEPFIKEDGYIVVDNLDFHGMIFDIDNIKNRNTKQLVKKIKRFKDWLENNPAYETKYYNIGDGIVISKRVK